MKEQGPESFLSQRDSAVVWAVTKVFWLQCQVRRPSELVLFILGKLSKQGLFKDPHTVEETAFLNHSSVKICFFQVSETGLCKRHKPSSSLSCSRIPLHNRTFQSPCYVPRSCYITGFYFCVTTERTRQAEQGKWP